MKSRKISNLDDYDMLPNLVGRPSTDYIHFL